MIALAQISAAALVGGQLALSLLSETEPAEGPDCTGWKIAFVAVVILAVILAGIVVFLLVRRHSLAIRLVATVALAYLTGPSISFVVRSFGVEFSVPGAGWSGVIVALAAMGVIGFLAWHRQTRAVSDPLAEHIDVVFDGFREGKLVQELADELRVPKTHITTIYYWISEIHKRLE